MEIISYGAEDHLRVLMKSNNDRISQQVYIRQYIVLKYNIYIYNVLYMCEILCCIMIVKIVSMMYVHLRLFIQRTGSNAHSSCLLIIGTSSLCAWFMYVVYVCV
jgi:hypothetical protein